MPPTAAAKAPPAATKRFTSGLHGGRGGRLAGQDFQSEARLQSLLPSAVIWNGLGNWVYRGAGAAPRRTTRRRTLAHDDHPVRRRAEDLHGVSQRGEGLVEPARGRTGWVSAWYETG